MPNKTKHVVIIGCGNVAWHIAKALYHLQDYNFEVYNHKANKAFSQFKKEFTCNVVTSLSNINKSADYYFICVSDKHIESVSHYIKPTNKNALVVHTSGSTSITAIKSKCANKAVFYPLQSFSKNNSVDWASTPLLVEASNATTKKLLVTFAKKLHSKIEFVNELQRTHYHLAAVVVNNFSNALFHEASVLLNKNKLKFNLLLPLIYQTVFKMQHLSPLKSQTGPAKRRDTLVIEKHLALLNYNKELQQLYKLLTKLIQKQ